MKKIKILSLLLIIAIVTPVISGCSLLSTINSTSQVLDKYDAIVANYYDEDNLINEDSEGQKLIYKNLFNADNIFTITYKAEINSAIVNNDARFLLLETHYKPLLEAAMSYFYKYRSILLVDQDSWGAENAYSMYGILEDLESALEEFVSAKAVLENLSSIDEGLMTENVLANFVVQYKNVIKIAIEFGKSFETAYLENIYAKGDYSDISIIQAGDMKRLAHSTQLHLAEIIYVYNIEYLEGFSSAGGNEELMTNLMNLTSKIDEVAPEDWGIMDTDVSTISLYIATRHKEEDSLIQENLCKRAIEQLNNLIGKTDSNSVYLISEYNQSILDFYQSFNSYALYAYDLISLVVPEV